MASVGGHTGPVGYQSTFAGRRPFPRKSSHTVLQPTSATLGQHTAKPAVGSGHSDVAEAAGRGRMSPTPTFLPLPLQTDSKCAPEPAVARDLGWGWRDEQEIDRILFS